MTRIRVSYLSPKSLEDDPQIGLYAGRSATNTNMMNIGFRLRFVVCGCLLFMGLACILATCSKVRSPFSGISGSGLSGKN